MAMIKPFIPFSLHFGATASLGLAQVASTMLTAGFQSSGYVNSDQASTHIQDTFKAGTLFQKVNTLFLQRERALEFMAGSLLANNQKDTEQNNQPVELTLDLAGMPGKHGEASNVVTDQPVMFATSNADSDNSDSELFYSLVKKLESRDPEERYNAIINLRRYYDQRAVEPLISVLADPNEKVRMEAACTLGELGDPRAVEPLLKELKTLRIRSNYQRSVKPRIIHVLGEIGDHRAAELLIKELAKEDRGITSMHIKAQNALIKLGGRAVGLLIEKLKGKYVNMSRVAARILVSIGYESVAPLIELLEDSNLSTIKEKDAIWILGKICDVRAIEPLSKKLMSRPPDVREKAVIALTKILDSRICISKISTIPVESRNNAVETFIHVLIAGSEIEQVTAANALGHFGDPRAVEPLLKALCDKDLRDMDVARSALVNIGNAAVEPLIKAMKDRNEDIRKEAIYALGHIGDPRAVEPLIKAMEDRNKDVRKAAIYALGHIGDPRAAEPLFKAIGDSDKDIGDQALDALVELGKKDVETLIHVLENGSENDRVQAAYVLGKLRNKRAVESLIKTLESPNEHVRKAAAQALEKFGRVVKEILAKKLGLMESAKQIEIMALFSEEYTKNIRTHFLRPIEENTKNIRTHFPGPIAEKITTITEEIQKNLVEKLGLSSHPAVSAESVASYGAMSMGTEMRQEIRQEIRLEKRQELLKADMLEIDTAESLEDAKELLKTLNFLVHHEMAHFIQEENKIPKAKLRGTPYQHIDTDQAQHNANETVIDKLAFDMAVKVYVHGDGDILFDETLREAVSIHSYLTLSTLVFRNHASGSRPMPEEVLARVIAVLQEMSASKAIAPKTKDQLKALAKDFHDAIATNHDEAYLAEIKKLINACRRIFRRTKLQI